MHRTQIYLDTTEWKLLKEIAKLRDSTLSELIREAISLFIPRVKTPSPSNLQNIVGLYRSAADPRGSVDHDDLYE